MDLHHLTACEAIRNAKARYCRLIDQKHWSEFRALFADGAVLRFYAPDGALQYEFTDLDAFVAMTADMLAPARTVHQVHNPEIALTGEGSAHALWSMEDRIVFAAAAPAPFRELHGVGFYEETLALQDGQWRITALTLRRTILEIDGIAL
jgi:3-phenylpropionate/cinnamic acid dioxygenase small subunit